MFQIPKHYVTQISIFSTLFSLPPTKVGIEGLTEENPLVLEQISKVDFKAFLTVLIPLYVNPIPHHSIHVVRELTASDVYKLPCQASPT